MGATVTSTRTANRGRRDHELPNPALVLTVAYWTYGPVLSRLLKLDPLAKTPAVELRDDVDYVPIAPKLLLGQHFSAIAAAGPIVGPILGR